MYICVLFVILRAVYVLYIMDIIIQVHYVYHKCILYSIILLNIYIIHIQVYIACCRAVEGEQGPQAELSGVRRTHLRRHQTRLKVRH